MLSSCTGHTPVKLYNHQAPSISTTWEMLTLRPCPRPAEWVSLAVGPRKLPSDSQAQEGLGSVLILQPRRRWGGGGGSPVGDRTLHAVWCFIALTQASIYHVTVSLLVSGFDKRSHFLSWSVTRHFICSMCLIQRLAHSSSAFLWHRVHPLP